MARLVGGTGIGIASMLSPMYIAEISPVQAAGRIDLGVPTCDHDRNSAGVLVELRPGPAGPDASGALRDRACGGGSLSTKCGVECCWPACCRPESCSRFCCSCRKARDGSLNRAAPIRPWGFSRGLAAAKKQPASWPRSSKRSCVQETGRSPSCSSGACCPLWQSAFCCPSFRRSAALTSLIYYGLTVLQTSGLDKNAGPALASRIRDR